MAISPEIGITPIAAGLIDQAHEAILLPFRAITSVNMNCCYLNAMHALDVRYFALIVDN